ncbi:hypothetical protein ACU8OT_29335 (plasmid) [Rhizobium leguminosarum]
MTAVSFLVTRFNPGLLSAAFAFFALAGYARPADNDSIIRRGAYLASIGVCEACHTAPTAAAKKACATAEDLAAKTDPDWFAHLSTKKRMAGGVPFIIRFGPALGGLVQSSNITPDAETGIGKWSLKEIEDAIRWGRRPDGTALFRFPPHTFFENLADNDVAALAAYLKSLPAVENKVSPRDIPVKVDPVEIKKTLPIAPEGHTRARAEYLVSAIVGCKECHSYHDAFGNLQPYVGGDPRDPNAGVFRLGPDLPIRQDERGFAAFPYPGYGVLYGGNLTRFGVGGDLHAVPATEIAKSLRNGLSTQADKYGRPVPLAHIMMWQFYRDMSSDDAMAIADYLRSLKFVPHDIGARLKLYGTDREAAFRQVFASAPSANDDQIFNLKSQPVPTCE